MDEGTGTMDNKTILNVNKDYWNTNADKWFGVTALPEYGNRFLTEDDLHLFGDVTGKTMLEICCGSGHSLKYHGDRKAGELWGLDISQSQLDIAKKYLTENNYFPRLICSPMEEKCGIPENYFDVVYSIYGIGWATDLQKVFHLIASYLKKDGIFIFSWQHPLKACVTIKDHQLVFSKSYFDEECKTIILDDMEMMFPIRKISTYINALAEAGFIIEKLLDQTDEATMKMTENIDDKVMRAQMIPLSFVIKAKKA